MRKNIQIKTLYLSLLIVMQIVFVSQSVAAEAEDIEALRAAGLSDAGCSNRVKWYKAAIIYMAAAIRRVVGSGKSASAPVRR